MRSLLLLFLSLSSPADAGSICNDGTYSYSEGRGTCSWHGGVATSEEYLDSQQRVSYRDQAGSNQRWVDSYDVTDDGIPYHSTVSVTRTGAAGYACFISKEQGIEETFTIVFPFNVVPQFGWLVTLRDNIKIFAGLSLISGNWAWTAPADGHVTLMKVKGNLQSPASADPLLPSDMTKIFNADHLVITIRGEENIVIPIPDAASKIASTWSKCKAML